jgi:putative thioredoxin
MIDAISSPYIHAANSENFKALVLDNSYKGPVLVNFWSRKAGPCLRQYPILDQLVHHYDGRLLLVNVDTEEEFIYTKEYAVTSVPLLKLFRHGQVVETWRGYQSETDLTKVLDLYVARESDQALAEAVRWYAEGRTREAYDKLTKAIIDDPVNPRLPVAMCKLLKHEQRFDEALKLIESLPETLRKHNEIRQLSDMLGFCLEADRTRDIPMLQTQLESRPDDLSLRQQLVAHYVMQQEYEPALQQLVAMMETDKAYHDNYPQQAMLRIFNLLGGGHPLVSQYRPNLTRYTH